MKNKHWFFIFLLWQVAGLLVTIIVSISAGTFHNFVHELMLCLTFTNFVAICAAAILLLHHWKLRHFLSRPLQIMLGVVCLAGTVYAGAQVGVDTGARICGIDNYEVGRWHLAIVIINFILLVVITVVSILLMLYQRLATNLEKKINENTRLARLQLETQFALLRSKVNPHFLFNTLNTMLEVLRREPQQVEKLILNLSDIYRKTLAAPDRTLVPIDEELDLVREYLEIEKIRMGNRLDYDFDVSDQVRQVKIPPMMLQILVENAVRHGLTPKKQGGSVSVKIERHNGGLEMGVRDTGVGIKQAQSETGYGLTCIRQQLQLLYDSAANLRISLLPTGGTEVTIALPL